MPSSGFQQQDQMTNFTFPKEAKHPQHGQPADKDCKKIKEVRSFEPRPGH
jgi:hypothetical protein